MAISPLTASSSSAAGSAGVQSSLASSEVAVRSTTEAPGRVERATATREALRRPAEVLANQLQRNEVRLSAVGRLRSAVAGIAEAATSLQGAAGQVPTTPEPLRTALRTVVERVNGEVRVAADEVFSRPGGGRPAPLGGDARVRLAAIEVRRGIDEPARNGGVVLPAIGLRRETDGTLAFDEAVFDAAFAVNPEGVGRALERFGQRVAATAGEQLLPGGNLGRSGQSADDRLEELLERAAAQQQAADTRDESPLANLRVPNNPFLVGGIAAYRGIFDL